MRKKAAAGDALRAERELASVALALLGPRVRLSSEEVRLCRHLKPGRSSHPVARFRQEIRAGNDPLGDTFSRIRSADTRRASGATYTPAEIVRAMVRWAASQSVPVRIVDPGAGSGRFLIAAARAFPRASLIGIELDPLAALLLRANLAALGLSSRTRIIVSDFRDAELPTVAGATLFIGNPPYVRHHQIQARWKSWFAAAASDLGMPASRLAGLHVHFYVKTMLLAKEGDYGSFITSAEWLDVNYGVTLRRLLADGMGGTALHVLDPASLPFADAATTGAIACFRIGRRPDKLLVQGVGDAREFGDLSKGREVAWREVESSSRWSTIIKPGPAIPPGYVELGEICRAHRGQVTGANHVWIAGEHSINLPRGVLKPAITKARDILNANGLLADSMVLRRVIDLPEDLDEIDPNSRKEVERFLEWAREQGADQSYIARHRRAWWAVGLRSPAPIVCTYMARRAPGFARNLCKARHINIAHGLYPRDPLPDATLDALMTWLRENVSVASGRTYAGGLTKFEPREMERIRVPRLENLAA